MVTKKKTSKKTSTSKKAPVAKKTPAVKKVTHFEKEIIPEEKVLPKKDPSPVQGDSSIFTTLLALFIVAFVVFGGYVYSRQKQSHIPEDTMTNIAIDTATPIDIATTVIDTPELRDILRVLPTMLVIEPDDIVESVRIVSDIALLQSQNADFFKNAQEGDYVLQLKNRTVLFRPAEKKIVTISPVRL